MKKIIVLVAALVISVGNLMAQDTTIADQDYCIKQDGNVIMYTKGMPKVVIDVVTLNDGTIVNPDGTFTTFKGKQDALAEGECLGMSGKKYASEDKLFQKVQSEKKKLLKKL